MDDQIFKYLPLTKFFLENLENARNFVCFVLQCLQRVHMFTIEIDDGLEAPQKLSRYMYIDSNKYIFRL